MSCVTPLKSGNAKRVASGLGMVSALTLAWLSSASAAEPVKLTLYSAQHGATMTFLAKGFTKQTGIEVVVNNGEAPETANKIIKDGAASPADVYLTENSPELMLVDGKGLLAPVEPSTLNQVPARYNAPNGNWVGVLIRESALVYNTQAIKPSELPASLMDFAKPEWKGKVAMAPSDVDFLPLTSAMVALKGEKATTDWLSAAVKTNATIFEDDDAIVKAVDAGKAPVGVINGFFWERFRNAQGSDKVHTALYHFKDGDAGALLNVTGAGVLKSSKHPAEAQQFLAYITSRPVQEALAQSDVDFEYPVVAGVPAHPAMTPFAELQPPAIDIKMLGDDTQPAALLHSVGLL